VCVCVLCLCCVGCSVFKKYSLPQAPDKLPVPGPFRLNGSVARVPGATMGGSVRKVLEWLLLLLYVFGCYLFNIFLSFCHLSFFIFLFRFLFVYFLNPRAMHCQCFFQRVCNIHVCFHLHIYVCVCFSCRLPVQSS